MTPRPLLLALAILATTTAHAQIATRPPFALSRGGLFGGHGETWKLRRSPALTQPGLLRSPNSSPYSPYWLNEIDTYGDAARLRFEKHLKQLQTERELVVAAEGWNQEMGYTPAPDPQQLQREQAEADAAAAEEAPETATEPQLMSFTGKCLAVNSGDTLVISHDIKYRKGKLILNKSGPPQTVRLYGIDAPEPDQLFFEESRQSLLALAGMHRLKVVPESIGADGILIAKVTPYRDPRWPSIQQVSFSESQLQRGAAWLIPGAAPSYQPRQDFARQNQSGLWRQTNPTAPWQWRALHPQAQ